MMILSDLAQDIGHVLGAPNTEISDICLDSRDVKPGCLFAALPGNKADGRDFIVSAVENGASAVLSTEAVEGVPTIVSENPRAALAQLAARFFAPQPKVMAAVTGTAGKTSVVSFLRQIWDEMGEKAASLGTTGLVALGKEQAGSLTTPDTVSLAKTLKELSQIGVTHCAMEASSHGLDQYRLHGVALAVAGFTNLGRDHLDYHPDMEAYFAAKMALFSELLPPNRPAVIFADDEWSARAAQCAAEAGRKVLTVGRAGEFISVKRVEHHQHRQAVELVHEGKTYNIRFPLAGDFQIANALVASGMAIAIGSEPSAVFAALEKLQGAPGRLELVGETTQGAPAYVDYAHKPEALAHVLDAVRPFTTGRIILVFGCGGDRDKGKRPIMGEIAAQKADVIYVTDDNPRSESPDEIRAQIMATCPQATEIGDRSQAIHAAVEALGAGDCLIVAGKGHEDGQKIGDLVLPFLDKAEVKEALLAKAADEGE